MSERMKDARLAEIRQFVNDVNNDLADSLSVADDHRLELLNAMDAERHEIKILRARLHTLTTKATTKLFPSICPVCRQDRLSGYPTPLSRDELQAALAGERLTIRQVHRNGVECAHGRFLHERCDLCGRRKNQREKRSEE